MIQTPIANATATGELLLQLTNVSKHYDDGNVDALKEVTATFATGSFTAILGPSGCGKSTLLNMIGGLDRPTSGDVLFRGESLTRHPDLNHYRAHHVGFVFQSYYLLPNLTAVENVQLTMFDTHPNRRDRVNEAQRLLEAVGLGDRLQHRPSQLSIGQRQRVAIARAIAGNPPLILADEPTGALDSIRGAEIMDCLQSLQRDHGSTLIAVTHDQRVADRADQVIEMADGRVQTTGSDSAHPEP